jgi:toxin YoeB
MGAPAKANRYSVFQPEFRDDLRYWVEQDRRTALRAQVLVEAILRDYFAPLYSIDKTSR